MTDAKAVVNRAFEVWDARDRDGYLALLTDDVVFRAPGGQEQRGKAAIGALTDKMFAAYSGGGTEVRRQFVDGEYVVSEVRSTGTQSGELRLATGELAPASGRPVDNMMVFIMRVVDGRIAESTQYFDRHAFLQQIGQLPAPATAG